MAFIESLPSVGEGRTHSADPVYESKLAEAFSTCVQNDNQPAMERFVELEGLPRAQRLLRTMLTTKIEETAQSTVVYRVVKFCVRAPSISVCWQPVLLATGLPASEDLFPLTKEEKNKACGIELSGMVWWQPAFRGPGTDFEQCRLSNVEDEEDSHSCFEEDVTPSYDGGGSEDSFFERVERDSGLFDLLTGMENQEEQWVFEFHAGNDQDGTRIGVEEATKEVESADPENPKGTVIRVEYVNPIKYRLVFYACVYSFFFFITLCEGLVPWAFLTNAEVHAGIEVDPFEKKLAYLICYYFGTPFQYLLHDAPVIAAMVVYFGNCIANLTFASFCGFFIAFWELIYQWAKCAFFDGCVAVGSPEFGGVPPDYQADAVKSFTTLVAVGTGVKVFMPLFGAFVGSADRFTLYTGALVTRKAAGTVAALPSPTSPFEWFKRKLQFACFLGAAKVMRPAVETVLAPMRLPGNYSYVLETHSSAFEPFPLEDEVWQKKVAAFWLLDEKAQSIKPIGLAAVVSGGLLTNKHVFDAIDAAYACNKEVFVGAVKREVRSTLGMVRFRPDDHIGPSDRNSVAFPVSADFTLLPLPADFSLLGIKSGGSTQFGGSVSKAVTGGFYKSDGSSWKFYLSPGITSPSNLILGGETYPGVSTWSGFSTFGASGCPLFASNGELLGLNVGAVSNSDGSDKSAIFIRASAILGYYLAKSKNKNHFKGNRFGLLDLVNPKVGKQAPVNQLEVDEHSTPDGQRDLDPTWYDDEAEDMAEAIRASMGEADEAVGQWAEDEEKKREEGRQTAKWFRQIGLPGHHHEANERKKGGRRRPDRDGGGREQINREDWHDGTNLEPVKVDQDEAKEEASTVEEKVEQVGSAGKEKTEQHATARPLGKLAKICCLGALFWGAVDVHSRLRKTELTDAEKQKKREIIYNLTEKFPLSQFEREFCTIHTFNDKPAPFAYDSKGNLLLEEIGVAGKSRIDVGSRKKKNKKKKDSSVDNATKITESLKEKLGFDFKPVAAETGHKAQRDSLIANCLKAIPDNFVPDEDHLKAFEAVHLVPFSPPNLADEAQVERLIRDAFRDAYSLGATDCVSGFPPFGHLFYNGLAGPRYLLEKNI